MMRVWCSRRGGGSRRTIGEMLNNDCSARSVRLPTVTPVTSLPQNHKNKTCVCKTGPQSLRESF